MPKRLTYEYVKGEFEKENYVLLTTEYRNAKQKLEYICPKSHKHSISWDNWKKGVRCPYCVGLVRLTIDFVRHKFKNEGYILLTNKYKNVCQKLNYICPNGHKHFITWKSWQQGKRCSHCSKFCNRYTIGDIKNKFEKEGYKLLTRRRKNNNQKLNYICPNGHKHSISWNNFQKGKRCPYCYGNVKMVIGFIRKQFEKENYTLLTNKYRNAHQKLNYICSKGHRRKITWNKWQHGRRCPFCSNNVSKWEKEVKSFISGLNINYTSNDRTKLINPNTNRFLELDLWFPQLNKAIECNGIYWHTDKERVRVDKIKQYLCEKYEIELLVLTDQEWYSDQDKCKNKIKNFCL